VCVTFEVHYKDYCLLEYDGYKHFLSWYLFIRLHRITLLNTQLYIALYILQETILNIKNMAMQSGRNLVMFGGMLVNLKHI
jgi:hypothetical protein